MYFGLGGRARQRDANMHTRVGDGELDRTIRRNAAESHRLAAGQVALEYELRARALKEASIEVVRQKGRALTLPALVVCASERSTREPGRRNWREARWHAGVAELSNRRRRIFEVGDPAAFCVLRRQTLGKSAADRIPFLGQHAIAAVEAAERSLP